MKYLLLFCLYFLSLSVFAQEESRYVYINDSLPYDVRFSGSGCCSDVSTNILSLYSKTAIDLNGWTISIDMNPALIFRIEHEFVIEAGARRHLTDEEFWRRMKIRVSSMPYGIGKSFKFNLYNNEGILVYSCFIRLANSYTP